MSALGDYGGYLTTAFGIALLLVAAWIGVRAGTEKTLRQQRDDALTDNDALRKSRDDRDDEIAQLREELAQAKARIDILQSVVTGEVHWGAISDVLEGHVREFHQHREYVEAALSEMRAAMRPGGAL